MRQHVDSIRIHASPMVVWQWLTELADHYCDWHPDHVSARWAEGEPNQVGSIMEIVEYLGGRRERLRLQVTEMTPPHTMRYAIRGLHGVVLQGGAFEVRSDNGGTVFMASVTMRGGPALERLLAARIGQLAAHMREEGQNLRLILESARFEM